MFREGKRNFNVKGTQKAECANKKKLGTGNCSTGPQREGRLLCDT